MNSHDSNTWSSYDRDSEKYFTEYSRLYFSKVHRQFIKYLPITSTSTVLDVGCGSGRDALALAKRGYRVTAVDPSAGMLRLAKEKNDHTNIIWLHDSLPDLAKLQSQKYNFILMSAVWMHIPAAERKRSISRMNQLLTENGRLALTLRIGPSDPNRMMHPVSLTEVLNLAKLADLEPIFISKENKDSFSRNNIFWQKIVLQRNTSK